MSVAGSYARDYPLDPNETLRLEAIRLLEVARRLPYETIDRITAFTRSHFGVPIGLVSIIEEEKQIIISRQGLDAAETPRKDSFCTYTILGPEALVVSDAREDSRFRNNPYVMGDPFIRFYAGAPLVYDGEVRLGALCLIDIKPRPFSRGQQAELAMLADHVVGVITSRAFDMPEPDLKTAFSM
jgi:GAF domain-containing protein